MSIKEMKGLPTKQAYTCSDMRRMPLAVLMARFHRTVVTCITALFTLLLLVSCGGGSGKSDEITTGPALSEAQLEVVKMLQQRKDAGEITEDEFDELRAQIEPLVIVEARFARIGEERLDVNDLIATVGYEGQEDCIEPPDFMLVAEIVPQTPVDPTDRLARRSDPGTDERASRIAVDDFLAKPGKPLSLDAMLLRSDVDRWGRHHARYRQTYGGVPLTIGGLVVHETEKGERVVSDTTLDFDGISVSTTPTVPDFDARTIALVDVDPTGALGYQATAELMIEPELENVLVNIDNPENGGSYAWQVKDARLVYQVLVAPDYTDLDSVFDVNFTSSSPTFDDSTDSADRTANTRLGGREEADPSLTESFAYPTSMPWLMTIDAITGAVLSRENLLEADFDELAAPPTTGTGYGYFNSRIELNTTYWPPFDAYVLADFSRSKPGTANLVMHGNNLDGHDMVDFDFMLDSNNVWGNGRIDFTDPACLTCTRGQTPAVDIAFGVQRTYDFLDNVLGRWGIDDAGLNQVAVAHWDTEYGDAHFNGVSGLIAFGNGKSTDKPGNYSLGTVAHEIGHAIWKQEGVGTSGNPAKAMNEGHGDVLGGLVDIYQDNTDGHGSWLYRIPWAGGKWRGRTRVPSSYDECGTINSIETCETGSRYWDFFTENSTFEHVAGIPFTRAIMHLAEGTSTDTSSDYYSKFFPDTPMRGIGLNKAARIWMHMVSHFLSDSPSLFEARLAAWRAAEDLYGVNSTEARATANAFAAIGMGGAAAGPASPSIPFAKVHTLNPRTLTARTYAVLDDDSGAEFVEPMGMARKNNAFLGYLDLSEMPVGQSAVTFRAVDSDGNETTTTRICNLRYRPQLLSDGGFEDESNSPWSNASLGDDEGGAFFGETYLNVGVTPTQQTVDLSLVDAPELSYWVGANKGIESDDFLRVRILDTGLNVLAVLAEHDIDEAWTPRPARSNGYVNFRHDLANWKGQEIVIEFSASRSNLFRMDHAVVSYASVQLIPPGIEMFETDNSVFLTISDDDFAPFEAMDLSPRIYLDGAETGPLVLINNGSRITVQLQIDEIGGAVHFAHTVAVTDTEAFIAGGSHEWFAPKPVNELLVNGRFEDQLDGWEVAGDGVFLTDANAGGFVFQGDYAVRLGGVGSANEASISRDVVVPFDIKSLKFTARVRREYSDSDPTVRDYLVVDFLNESDEVLDQAVLYDTSNNLRLDHEPPHNFKTHVLVSYAPSTAALAGKTVKVKLRTVEDDEGASTFVVDNASLSYAVWGLQIGF